MEGIIMFGLSCDMTCLCSVLMIVLYNTLHPCPSIVYHHVYKHYYCCNVRTSVSLRVYGILLLLLLDYLVYARESYYRLGRNLIDSGAQIARQRQKGLRDSSQWLRASDSLKPEVEYSEVNIQETEAVLTDCVYARRNRA